MTIASSNPSSITSAGAWSTTTNVYSSNDTYATNTGSTQNTEYPLDVSGFDFSSIPIGATINSVTVSIESKASSASRSQIKGELYDGSTAISGSLALTTMTTTTDTTRTFNPTATLAQLQSANLLVRVTNKRIVSQACTTSVDYVKIDVDYSVVAVTQAAYRVYADGTESGSTALAAQDTAYAADASATDMSLLLRVRLQSTSGSDIPGTTDFRLQFDKNASGSWTDVTASSLAILDNASDFSAGTTSMLQNEMETQSFTGNGGKLGRISLYMRREGSPASDARIELRAHTGTYGTDSLPTGTALASATLAAGSVGTSMAWHDFDFDGTYTLTNATHYVLVFCPTTVSSGNTYYVAFGNNSHSGNNANWDPGGFWSAFADYDMAFRTYTVVAASSNVTAFASSNLTDAEATTNRLTGGSGSFVAGKVSEDGLVDDMGWTVNNYTELLYAITLKAADLVNGDVLTFRVLKDGATTGMTYSQTPTLSISPTAPVLLNVFVHNPARVRTATW